MKISRRPLFFGILFLICVALLPVTPSEFHWVNVAAAGLAAFWALLLAIEELAAQRRERD